MDQNTRDVLMVALPLIGTGVASYVAILAARIKQKVEVVEETVGQVKVKVEAVAEVVPKIEAIVKLKD
jgi:hypothetical protein